MKTLSKTVLPLLLFVFGLFVVHDYVIDMTDADTQYELCYAQYGDVNLDPPSQLHAHIHILLDVPIPQHRPLSVALVEERPESVLAEPHTRTQPVQLRPPLV